MEATIKDIERLLRMLLNNQQHMDKALIVDGIITIQQCAYGKVDYEETSSSIVRLISY